MKAFKFFRLAVILSGILLSACAGAPSSPSVTDTGSTGAEDSSSSEVVFTGLIESMDGDQWVINGQTLTVDASALQGGPFMIGDTVKVEAVVTGDGSVTAKIVESPSAVDLAEAQGTPAASPAATSLVFDDSGTEAVGTVEAITDMSITVGGQTFHRRALPPAPGDRIGHTLDQPAPGRVQRRGAGAGGGRRVGL